MFNRSMDYIDKNSILNEKQFGFRTNHSTYMAIIELFDKVVSAVERNESIYSWYILILVKNLWEVSEVLHLTGLRVT